MEYIRKQFYTLEERILEPRKFICCRDRRREPRGFPEQRGRGYYLLVGVFSHDNLIACFSMLSGLLRPRAYAEMVKAISCAQILEIIHEKFSSVDVSQSPTSFGIKFCLITLVFSVHSLALPYTIIRRGPAAEHETGTSPRLTLNRPTSIPLHWRQQFMWLGFCRVLVDSFCPFLSYC